MSRDLVDEKPKLLSLFCGCGGLDLGFEKAGFTIGCAYDLRPAAIASHNQNRGKHNRGFVRDVSCLKLSEIDADFGAHFSPRGVIGGPPCQSFSRGNASKRDDDPRTALVRKYFGLALSLHRNRGGLDFVVMENVPEVARAQGGKLLGNEIQRLRESGFEVHSHIYDSSNYGVAQTRKRLILVALNKDRIVETWRVPPKANRKLTVKDQIAGLEDPVFFSQARDLQVFPEHPNHWCMTPKSEKFSDGSLTPGRSTGRSFKTLAWDKPSYTVSYGHREVHVHPDCTRRLSVYEAMRLQGFPKSFILQGTLSDQLSQVSEAVPPPLAKAVAKAIARALYSKCSESKRRRAD